MPANFAEPLQFYTAAADLEGGEPRSRAWGRLPNLPNCLRKQVRKPAPHHRRTSHISMWCEHCRQNVTGTLSQTQSSVCCSRCGCALPGEMPAPPLPYPADDQPAESMNALTSNAPPCPAPPRPTRDQWDIEEDLRHIERLVRRDRVRLDLPGWGPTQTDAQHESAPIPTTAAAPSPFTTFRAGVAWLLLCIGLSATVCGLTLLAWHWLGHRAELLIPGLACAAAGQFFLLGGFLLQPPRDNQAPTKGAAEHSAPAEIWLDAHRRIDAILRTDLPGPRTPPHRAPGERSSH